MSILSFATLLIAAVACIEGSSGAVASPLGAPAAGEHLAPQSCAAVKPIFLTKNLSVDVPLNPVPGFRGVCGSEHQPATSCCTAEMEDRLKVLVRHDLQAVIRHSALSVQGVLDTNAAIYKERLLDLVDRFENRTQQLIAENHMRLAPKARAPIAALHAELRRALTEPLNISSKSLNKSTDTEGLALEDAVNTFFSQLFPLVYHYSMTQPSGQLSPDYAVCLQATMTEVSPFGETPHAMAMAISKSLRATRVLLRALKLAVHALDATERVWEQHGEECGAALVRMSYCARCAGLATVKPCSGFCLNVLRGCLAHLAELDSSWNGFVDSVERLIMAVHTPSAILNAEAVLWSLDARVSNAILHAMETGPALEKRVKVACGPAQWVDSGHSSSSSESTVAPLAPVATSAVNSSAKFTPRPLAKEALEVDHQSQVSPLLHAITTSLARSRGFYAGLSDSLCSDDSFAETAEDADCWNGQRVAQYAKTVVDPSVGAQKYNPELAWASRHQPDGKIALLSDRLRQTRQLLLAQLTAVGGGKLFGELETDSLRLEGSGSGHLENRGNPDWGDDEDGEGSGSGDRPFEPPNLPGDPNLKSPKPNGNENESKVNKSGVSTGRTNNSPRTLHVSPWSWLCALLLVAINLVALERPSRVLH